MTTLVVMYTDLKTIYQLCNDAQCNMTFFYLTKKFYLS